MRRINSIEDAQKAINELLDWKELHSSKDWDMRGLRISNASDGTKPQDYATVAQLPKIIQPEEVIKDLDYGIYWSKEGFASVGDLIPAGIIGKGREGKPHQIHLTARGVGSFSITLYTKQVGQDPIAIGDATWSSNVSTTSTFELPTPTLGYLHTVYPDITAVNGAASPTVLLIVRRFRDNLTQ